MSLFFLITDLAPSFGRIELMWLMGSDFLGRCVGRDFGLDEPLRLNVLPLIFEADV